MARITQQGICLETSEETPHRGIDYPMWDGTFIGIRDSEGAQFIIPVALVERMMGVIETVRKEG